MKYEELFGSSVEESYKDRFLKRYERNHSTRGGRLKVGGGVGAMTGGLGGAYVGALGGDAVTMLAGAVGGMAAGAIAGIFQQGLDELVFLGWSALEQAIEEIDHAIRGVKDPKLKKALKNKRKDLVKAKARTKKP